MQGPGQPARDGDRPALSGEGRPQGMPQGRNPGQPGGGFPGGNDDQNPVWVEAEVAFAGRGWGHVGIRFKGNSSLRSTRGSGSLKLPFKLDFDQFEDDQGNVYKPEGSGATFAEGSFSEASFDKETNQDSADYSDILALYDALHSDKRNSDPESWRQNLEEVFDVDGFLNWLAVNTTIQNWDTYGVMNHNYYLYNDPDQGRLVWIPWDNNESLKAGGGMRKALSLDLGGANDNWPLISYLRDDPVYYQKYQEYLSAFLDEVFIPDILQERFQTLHELITPYVIEEVAGSSANQVEAFSSSVDEVVQHVNNRDALAAEFLGH
jgi:spore coat protein H